MAPEDVAALQARVEAAETSLARSEGEAEAEVAQAKADLTRQVEEAEAKIAALTEQLESEQSGKSKIAEESEGLVAELKEALARSEAELTDLRGALDAARQSASQAGTQALEEARNQVAALEAAITEERSKSQGLEAALRRETEQAANQVRGLYQRFSELGGAHTERGMLLKLRESELRFQPAQATLTDDDLPSLDRLAALLAEHPNLRVRIEGYTDSLGDESINLALSRERAEAVKQALVERGVQAERLSAEGMGSARPIADNAVSAGRAQNRRVEVYVVEG
jgi:chemotaxis protein MotB